MTRQDEDGGVVRWRQLDRHLWAGSGPSGPLGTIERGRRFVALDVEGLPCGWFRTLDEAEAALEAAGPA